MERTELIENLTGLVEAGTGVVRVTGPAGAGKTTIARSAIERAEGGRLVWCDPLDPPIPNGPFRALAARADRPDAARLLASGDRDAAADAIASMIDTGILVIDDAHWIDQASAELLSTLTERLGARGGGLVVTENPEISSPGLRAGLRAIGDTADLAIPPLDEGQVAELLPEGMDVAETVEHTGGNALLVRLAAVAATPSLDLRSMVLAHFDVLTLSTREIVEALAVSPTGWSRAMLDRLHPGWQTNLAPAEEAGLVSVTPEVVRFAHERLRRVVADELTEMRIRFLHQRILEHLDDGADPAVVSFHAEGAGSVEREIEARRNAAREAERAGSDIEAAAQLERLLRREHSIDPAELEEIREEHRICSQRASRFLDPETSTQTE